MKRNKGQGTIQYITAGLVVIALVGSWMAYSSAGQASTQGLAEKKDVSGLKDRIAALRKRIKALEEGQSSIKEKIGAKIPARLTVTSVAAPSVKAGETATITVSIANTGGKSGTKDLSLKIAGETKKTKSVTVAGGSSKTVTFDVPMAEAGEYEVSVDGATTTLTVEKVAVKKPKKPWEKIQWNEPEPWAERLKGVENIGRVPDSWIEDYPKFKGSFEVYPRDKKAAKGGYTWPEGWKEATEGVKKISFYNYGGLPHDPAVLIAAAKFYEKTGIKVNPIPTESLTLWLKTVSAMTSQKPTPVLIHHAPLNHFTHIAKAGWAQRIDWFWPKEVRNLYGRGFINLMKQNGHFYAGGPVGAKTFLLYYRPSILKEATGSSKPPQSWKEILDVAKKVSRNTDKIGFAIPGKSHLYVTRWLGMMTYAQGGELVKEGKLDVTSPEFKNSFRLLANYVRKGAAPEDVFGWGWFDGAQTFYRGRTAMTIAGSVNAARYKGSPTEAIKGDWAATKIPPFEKGIGIPGKTVMGMANWCVNKYADPKKKAAALLFMDFYRSFESQWNEVSFEGNDAPIPELYTRDDIKGEIPAWESRYKSVQNHMQEALPMNGEQMAKYIKEEWQKAAGGEKSIEQALTSLKKKIAKLLG